MKAAAGKAIRYPAVGPRNRKIPGAPPGAKNVKPTAPSIRCSITATAPNREPSNAPVSNTAKLCPVIGIGPIWIENCAAAAMNKLKTITNPAERTESSGASAASINVSALAYELICLVYLVNQSPATDLATSVSVARGSIAVVPIRIPWKERQTKNTETRKNTSARMRVNVASPLLRAVKLTASSTASNPKSVVNLITGFIATDEVSLKGSPTVSPTTVAS